jgi:flagellar motor switch protein FliM
MPNSITIGVFQLNPLPGQALICVGFEVLSSIVDRMLGGMGSSENSNRELTDIETTVIEKFVGRMLGYLNESWKDIIEVMPRIVQMESNPQFVQVVGPTEMVVLLSFEVKVGEVSGILNMCYPAPLIDPIVSKLSAQYWFSNVKKEKTEENLEAIRKRLNKVAVPVVANLGENIISFEQFIELNVGDVIPLNQSIHNPCEVYVGNKLKFKAVPGLEGKKMAISIKEILEERGE